MTYVWDSGSREWQERAEPGVLNDAWFRLPSSGCTAHWNFTNLGASLTDTINSIVLAPHVTYPDVTASSWRGVPCIDTSINGFLEGWDEQLRWLGDITIEGILVRHSSEATTSKSSSTSAFIISRGNYESESLKDNYPYAAQFTDYGTQIRWDHENDAGVGNPTKLGYCAALETPTYIAWVRDGYEVKGYCFGELTGSGTVANLPNGATSIEQTITIGGDKELNYGPSSTNMSIFSAGITKYARTAEDIRDRWQASLAGYYI